MADPIKITNGPSLWDLAMSLFEGKKVTFSVEEADTKDQIDVYIRAVSNDHSTEWSTIAICEYGNLFRDSLLLEGVFCSTADTPGIGTQLTCYISYSVRNRKGLLSSGYLDKGSSDARDDQLRLVWGDKIYGNSFWRTGQS